MAGKQEWAGKQERGRADVRRPFTGAGVGLEAGFGDRAAQPPARTPVVQVKQVHGDGLADPDDVLRGAVTEADGLVVRREGVIVAVKTADCVPVLLLGPAAGPRFAAAVHAGWRGTIAGIVERAVERAAACGVDPAMLQARLGPSIGPCCYEVGEEVAIRFEERGLPVLCDGPRPRLDLRAVNSTLLERAGVRSDRIQLAGPCTRCRRDLYWSYRGEPGVQGRQLSWIGWARRGA